MSDQPCLSIIIPVYNAGRYLGKCLDSLLKASNIDRTQIILVDDGSTDDSGVISDSYADKYEFIDCLHEENGGPSAARNRGLKTAVGKYVYFCDADDMVIPEGMSRLIDCASEDTVDVLLWDGMAIDENDSEVNSDFDVIMTHKGLPLTGDVLSGTEALVRLNSENVVINMTVWLRACRREFLMDNKLFFKDHIIHEDELWVPQVMVSAETVRYIPEKLYCYRMSENSIMRSSDDKKKHAEDFVTVMNLLYEYYVDHIIKKDQLNTILTNWADSYLWGIVRYDIGDNACRKQIKRSRILLSCRVKIKGILLCLFGVKIYCKIYELCRKG